MVIDDDDQVFAWCSEHFDRWDALAGTVLTV